MSVVFVRGRVGPQVNKIVQISNDDPQMSVMGDRSHVWLWGMGGGKSYVWFPGEAVTMPQYIMSNHHTGIPSPEQNDRQTCVKTLPSRNFVNETI